jgi:hypothetical protein
MSQDEILETFRKAQESYARLANVLMNADVQTLTEAQVEVENLSGYIISVQGQSFQLKMTIMQIEEFIKVAKSMIDKVQRSISQAIKDKQFI